MENFKDRFAALIYLYRTIRQLTQKQLADAIGCSHCDISCWESGRTMPHLTSALKVAAALGIKLDAVQTGIVQVPQGSIAAKRDELRQIRIERLQKRLEGFYKEIA